MVFFRQGLYNAKILVYLSIKILHLYLVIKYDINELCCTLLPEEQDI